MQSFFNEYGGQLVTKSLEHLYISFAALLLGRRCLHPSAFPLPPSR